MKFKILTVFILSLSIATTAYTADTTSSSEQNKQKGESFLINNKNKNGVITLSDGLQYKVIKKGTGPKPSANDVVSVNYEGRLINGEEFDSSKKHGGPVSFTVNQVIPGWSEALQLMPTGSTWELYIPANLAYGEQGVSTIIGPNETLIFKVTLIGVTKSSS